MKNSALGGKVSQKSVCSQEWGSESKSMRTGYTTQGKRLDMKIRSTTFYPELAGVETPPTVELLQLLRVD